MDYIKAGEIRRKYPEILSRQDIDAILEEWIKNDAERGQPHMLWFSAIFDHEHVYDTNESEFELWLRIEEHYGFADLCNGWSIGGREFYGMLAVTVFENLTNYKDPHATKKETYKLRLELGESFLNKCQNLDAKELSNGFKKMREIRAKVAKMYPHKRHPWQKKLDKLVDRYIVKNENRN